MLELVAVVLTEFGYIFGMKGVGTVPTETDNNEHFDRDIIHR